MTKKQENQEAEQMEPEQLECESAMPEAPASLNLRFASQHGYECQLTIRSFDSEKGGVTLLSKLKAIEESLHKKGCKPIFGKNGPPKKAAAPAPEPEEEHPPEKPCPIHNVMMKKRTGKDSQVWYSHKLADGSWCNGKE